MHAEKLVPAVIAAVAVACLLFAGRAHGHDGYVPAAASQQVKEPPATKQNVGYVPAAASQPVKEPPATKENEGYVPAAASQQVKEPEPEATKENEGYSSQQMVETPLQAKFLPEPQKVEEPLARKQEQKEKFLPKQPEVMPVPTLFKRGFSVYASSKTHPSDVSSLAGKFGGYIPQPTTTTEPEAEPAAGTTTTTTTTKTEPAPETTTEPEAEPAPETTYEPVPAAETTTEPEAEPAPETPTVREPEPVTPTAPGQGDFYRTGETPTKPEPPAKPSSPGSYQKSFSFNISNNKQQQVDDDGEPVEGLSPKAIANILNEHNVFRAKEGEKPLTWNATVAKYAQQYAEQRKGDCALKHSTGPYGENLMYGDGKSWTWRHTVDEWSAEKKNYHYSTNTCDPGKMCGHYTAVVWKDTTAVGCGRVTCTSGNTLMVCSYYPPGNYDGEKPY